MNLENSVRKMYINSPSKFTHFNKRFILWGVKQHCGPYQLLKEIVQECINKTVEESTNQGVKFSRIDVCFSSELLFTDIYVPIRKIAQNSSDIFMNKFENMLLETKQRNGSLLEEPFTITITGYAKKKFYKAQHLTVNTCK